MTDRTPTILPSVTLTGADAGRDARPARQVMGMWEHLCHHPDYGL